ncbi:MAG: oxidoreductase [Gemmatimonadales bacterium]
MPSKSALVAGATGLVGSACLTEVLASPHYREVTALVRRPIGLSHPKLTECLVDFERLESDDPSLQGDDVFCCLGTTMKAAGSKDAFRRVDYDYPLALARTTRGRGAQQFVLVSSMGAKPRSLSFYLRVKGELEEALRRLGFTSLVILRPSLLLGTRQDRRLGETLAQLAGRVLAPLVWGSLAKYRPVSAGSVAKVMVEAANLGLYGVHVIESDRIGRGLGG